MFGINQPFGSASNLTSASNPPSAANPTTAAPPAASNTSAQASSSDFRLSLDNAKDKGVISEPFAAEIKLHFASPFAAAPAAAPAASTGAGFGHATGSIGLPIASSSQTAPSSTSRLAAMNAPQRDDSNTQRLSKITDFIQLLLLCESGFNNSEAAVESESNQKESIAGLHAAVGVIANSAATNLVTFLQKELTSSTLGYEGLAVILRGHSYSDEASSDRDVNTSFTTGAPRNVILLTAQCLYLLTRHFQMTESFVKEALTVVDQVLEQVRTEMSGRAVRFRLFRESSETAGLCTLTWLLVFSVANCLGVWKQVRAADGKLGPNALLRSDVASTMDHFLSKMQGKFEPHAEKKDGDLFNFLPSSRSARAGHGILGSVAGAGNAAADSPALLSKHADEEDRQMVHALAVVDGFVSILTLVHGCFLRAKGDDRSYDVALDAFLGDRGTTQRAARRGKVAKRMAQLAPSPMTLLIPTELMYIAPYEILSFLFDDMLPLLRHISDLEVSSYKKYTDQRQLLEELPRQADEHLGSSYVVDEVTGHVIRGSPMNDYVLNGARLGKAAAEGKLPSGFPAPSLFTSEMAHILELLVVCLEHLPPEVLNPDLDTDCAATFFIFRNCIKHLSQVFHVQGGSLPTWENFTLKLVARFLEVLTMIGRNPQYTERVMAMLTDAQAECHEIQWSRLIQQSLESAGFNGTSSVLQGLQQANLFDTIDEQHLASTRGHSDFCGHRQFTKEYRRKCQRLYISSFFMLLRQLFSHPVLRATVSEFISLELALSFIFAPYLNQTMLGNTLSLVATLITNPSEAELVWTFLDRHGLLQPPQFTESAEALRPLKSQQQWARGSKTADERMNRDETFSLLGHCQYEQTAGTYCITSGFLNLVIALLRHDQPTLARYPIYTTVTYFIAQDVFRGILRRVFNDDRERYTVMALAAAALRQALLVRFNGEEPNTVIPFATIMATDKAPTDVVGEVVQLITRAGNATFELMSHQRAAIRQCLQLIITAVHVAAEQKLEIFSLDSRTTQNTALVVNLLTLCAAHDVLLGNTALQLLLLFPCAIMNQATRSWNASAHRLSNVVAYFTTVLMPSSVCASLVRAPPELAMLDAGPMETQQDAAVASSLEAKSLLLDLFIQHASTTEPSIVSWACGFYAKSPSSSAPDTNQNANILFSIVEGAQSELLERTEPGLAVKYVKLLYLLRANRLYGAGFMRDFMELRCSSFFLVLQSFRPDRCDPIVLSKYAYILKMLALEACFIYQHAPQQLHLNDAATPTIATEVLLSLLHPRNRTQNSEVEPLSQLDDGTGSRNGAILSRDAAADMTQWLSQALQRLPPFPECRAPNGGDQYIVRAADGIVQYHIRWLYDAFQQEQVRQARPPLTLLEIREKLSPFVEANECFLLYAAAINFVEGWCQLLDISCYFIQGVGSARLRAFAGSIIDGLNFTSAVTVAAQEHIAYRLCSSLSTVMTRLHEHVQGEVRRMQAAEAAVQMSGTGNSTLLSLAPDVTSAAPLDSRTGIVEGSRSALARRDEGASIGARRARDEAPSASSIFATAAGNRSNLLSTPSRLQHIKTLRQQAATKEQASGSANQVLLRPLVTTVVQWGARLPITRADLYASLLTLTMVPGVVVDDVVVYRLQRALMNMIAEDICSVAPTPSRQQALALLLQLLQSSPALCDYFCNAAGDSTDTLGLLAARSAAALLENVDRAVFQFTTNSGPDLGSTLWLIRSTFDVLSAMSLYHASQVLRANLVTACLAMESWRLSAQVVLGYSSEAASWTSPEAKLRLNKELFRHLLLGSMRWINVLLATSGGSLELVYGAQDFIRGRRQLIQYMLESPLNAVAAEPMTTTTLQIFAEITNLLRGLSETQLAEECRVLVADMAIPELLVTFTRETFVKGCNFKTDPHMESGVYTEPSHKPQRRDTASHLAQSVASSGTAPSERQLELIAQTVRNASHFLLRTEYGLAGSHVNLSANLPHDTRPATGFPMLRDNVNQIKQVLHATVCVSQALASDHEVSRVHEFRFECSLLALHALVCLLHSLVLPPLTPKPDGPVFAVYLHQLPIQQLLEVLQVAQHSVNALHSFNADFRGGIQGRRVGSGWAINAPSVSNRISKQLEDAKVARRGASPSSPGANPADLAKGPSTPSTPAMHPADGNVLMGTKQQRGSAEEIAKADERSFTNRLSTIPFRGEPSYPSDAHQLGGMTEGEQSALAVSVDPHNQRLANMTTTQLANVPPGTSLADVLQVSQPLQLYNDASTAGQPAPHDAVNSATASWESILSIESTVRQLKIAIANAIRTTTTTIESLGKR